MQVKNFTIPLFPPQVQKLNRFAGYSRGKMEIRKKQRYNNDLPEITNIFLLFYPC